MSSKAAKELLSKPDFNIISHGDGIKMQRSWLNLCPICREEFYCYKRVDIEKDYPERYIQPTSNQVDSHGNAKMRITCGSSECYEAEHSHFLRVSTFNKQTREDYLDSKMPKRPQPGRNLTTKLFN